LSTQIEVDDGDIDITVPEWFHCTGRAEMFFSPRKNLVTGLVILGICAGIFGCSKDAGLIDLSGYWTGRTQNNTTRKSWDCNLYFDQDGDEVSVIYTDYRGNISIYNTSYSSEGLEFSVDIYPGTVVFFGTLSSDNRINGTWTYSEEGNDGIPGYSENGNDGIWGIIRDDDNFSEGDNPSGQGSGGGFRPVR